MPRYFNDFTEGQAFETRGRTITEGDIHQFAQFTGDWNPVHVDETFAQPLHGGRIAHGPMFPGIAFGMLSQHDLIDGSAIALRSLAWEFLDPVHIGDTIKVLGVVTSTSPHPTQPDRGRVSFDIQVRNQDNETVNKGTVTIVVAAEH
ncbi:MAG: MaoC/PaaZ C-terminal domain-containing protein [Pseudomonadota bacterium]